MNLKVEKIKMLDYFGGASEFLMLCANHVAYQEEKDTKTPMKIDCITSEGLTTGIVRSMCVFENKNCIDIIIHGERCCIELSDEIYESLVELQQNMLESESEYSKDDILSFKFINGKMFFVHVEEGMALELKPIDYKKFEEALPLFEKLMED